MMAIKARYLLPIFILVVSCKKDFIVEDISKKNVVVLAPADSLVTSANLITFWWEQLDGVEKYNLQIVEPDFKNTKQLLLDTNVTANKIQVSLRPGAYQWRIRGTNAGHSTAFGTFNLTIDTTSDLSQQFVNRVQPANGKVLGSAMVLFSWTSIGAADQYRLQVNEGALFDTILTANQISLNLPAPAGLNTSFTWNVKAINEQSQSSFNPAAFSFTVDLKPPPAPSLLSPVSGSSVPDTTKLVWLRSGGADVLNDSIYVASDSIFQNVISQTSAETPGVRISELSDPPSVINTQYWWRVKSFDAVGNKSNFSVIYKFKLVTP